MDSRTLHPDGTGANGVLLLSDHMTDGDKVGAKALCGAEGGMLARALSRYGWRFEDFYLASAAFCSPTPRFASQAARTCSLFDQHLRTIQPKVILTVGRLAFERVTGQKVSPMLARGYVWPTVYGSDVWCVAALPTSYYRVDPSASLPTFLSDAAKAVRIAAEGFFAYDDSIRSVWQPDAATWDAYVREFLRDPTRPLASDVETLWKRRSEMSEEELTGDDLTYTITEFNVAYDDTTGVSVPWTDAYIPGVKAMIAASQREGVTLFWNGSYDIPRLEHNGVPKFDWRHTRDVMDSWRVLRNSVRRKLAVATSMLPSCWNIRPFKHLGSASEMYRSYDVVTLFRNDRDILEMLRAEGQDRAHSLFVTRLDPHLTRMTDTGLLTDAAKVEQLSAEVGQRLLVEQAAMTALVPTEQLPTQVWKGKAAAEAGLARLKEKGEVLPEAALVEVPATREVQACGACGAAPVTKGHVTAKTLPAIPTPLDMPM